MDQIFLIYTLAHVAEATSKKKQQEVCPSGQKWTKHGLENEKCFFHFLRLPVHCFLALMVWDMFLDSHESTLKVDTDNSYVVKSQLQGPTTLSFLEELVKGSFDIDQTANPILLGSDPSKLGLTSIWKASQRISDNIYDFQVEKNGEKVPQMIVWSENVY